MAADFSINPAAARMRWSRLKKSINPDDIASNASSPVENPKSPSKSPKKMKPITKELKKEKRTERKAKIRAEHKIEAVVKNEKMQEEEEEVGGSTEANSGHLYQNGGDSGEQILIGQSNFEPAAIKMENGYMGVNMLNTDQIQTNNDNNTPAFVEVTQPAFGLFQLPPSTPPNLFPAFAPAFAPVPLLNISPVLDHGIDDETENEAWGTSITIKHAIAPNPNDTINPMFITSPVGSSASFSPESSSASPTTFSRKQPTQRWDAASNSRARRTCGRSRRIVDEEDEDFEA